MSLTTDYCDVLVIGSGLAGMSATFFSLDHGLKTIQIGSGSPLQFYNGFFDLMSTYPIQDNKTWDNPWDAIEKLCQEKPNHPYAYLTKEQMLQATGSWLKFLEHFHIDYNYIPNKNIEAITPIGTLKLTHAVPKSIWNGIHAMMQNQESLLVDIEDLKGFSSRQIKDTLQNVWPALETSRIKFPGTAGEVFTNHMANALESSSVQEQLVELLLPRAQQVKNIGFPAMLGSFYHSKVCTNLEKMMGKTVFEIPTLPLSMHGIRLRNALTHGLTQKGGQLIQKTVTQVEPDGKYGFIVHAENQTVFAKNIILANGRFMGKGLVASRTSITEPLFQLPIYQPESRRKWHHKKFFDHGGHGIHEAGIEVDQTFRPVDHKKKIVNDNLYAIGTVLAHNNWMRYKCGAGVSIGSAFGALSHIVSK
jgi:glycerol-3-phosphate dehydrogenase subunit B